MLANQCIDVDQITKPARKIGILEQMHRSMNDLIGRVQHHIPLASRLRSAAPQQFL